MTYLKTYFSTTILVFFLFGISGCQSIDVRGQFISDKAIQEINAAKPTQEELVEMIGTPTYIPDYTENTWYYIQRSLARRAWFDAKVTDQRIVKITFDKSQKVDKAILENSPYDNTIAINSLYTPTHGTEKTGIQKFVKNIGRFNQTTNGANKRKNTK
jgi:outer membrane protein assembly factor BamE (lipoprotein component of BamABCDE complex)